MVYISVGLLIIGVGFILIFSGYRLERLKELYHMRGIYRLLYPPACFLYRRGFKKNAAARLEALRLLYPSKNPEHLLEERYLKNISHALLIFLAVGIASLALAVSESQRSLLVDDTYITRNGQGEGAKKVELIATVGGDKEDVSVIVGEKRLDSSQMAELKVLCESYIDENVLGDNPSPEHVTSKLNFFTEVPGYSVSVQWHSSDYLMVGMDGTVKNGEIKEPVAVTLTAVCTYFDESWEYGFDVWIEPMVRDEDALREEALYEALASQESKTAGEDYLALPDSIGGENVVWSEKAQSSAGLILLLGAVAVILIFARESESCARQQKLRAAQLDADYPVFVHKVVLLLGTGMTSKSAWFRIISDYNKSLKEGGEQRYVYEEMIVAANEMKQGITEVAAYENFGRRCKTSQYLKFSSILIQSVRTGARGMGRMLADAGDEAVILRRENAKRLGEEAGTKLLFPMVVLLGVIMFIVIIPAFMSMNF